MPVQSLCFFISFPWLYLLFLRLATGNCRVFFYSFLFRVLAGRCGRLLRAGMPVFRAYGSLRKPSQCAEKHEYEG